MKDKTSFDSFSALDMRAGTCCPEQPLPHRPEWRERGHSLPGYPPWISADSPAPGRVALTGQVTDGMPIKIRVIPDCIVIPPQNSRELWGCDEGLSIVGVNVPKMNQWLKAFPGVLNDTVDQPAIKRGNGHCG